MINLRENLLSITNKLLAAGLIEIKLGSSPAYNPAFDVTPAKYVTKFICEKGIFDADEIKNIEEL